MAVDSELQTRLTERPEHDGSDSEPVTERTRHKQRARLSTSAERMRRHRERRAAGLRVMSVEVFQGVVEAMADQGYLSPDEMEDDGAVARVIGEYLEVQFDQ